MTYIVPRFYKWGMRKTQFGELMLNDVSSPNFCLLARVRDNRRETAIPRRGIAISRRGTDFSSSFLEFIYYMKRICNKCSRARSPARLPCRTSYQVDMVIP